MHELAEEQADLLRVFSNPKRILILWALSGKELSVSDIATAIDASIQNTSQHLRLMKEKNLLKFRREGHSICYRVADNDVGQYCQSILQEYLKRLKSKEIDRVS